MNGLLLALAFLTRLPVPQPSATTAEFAASMRWFPAAGLVIGPMIAAAGWLGAQGDPWIGALLATLVWVGLTGALHLDGLGDIADAAGAAHGDRTRMMAVLTDPHLGSFGVTAIALQLAAKLVLLHGCIDRGLWPGLALIPFAARIGPLAWTLLLPPLHDGLGARFHGAVRPRDIGLWLAALTVAGWFAPGLLAAFILIPLWAWWIMARIGGISGDGHGAGIETVETGLLLALLLA